MNVNAYNSIFLRKKAGIYIFINKINNKFYIGSSKNIYSRMNNHINHLKKETHSNKFLQNAWNKYGQENFIFEVLEIVNDISNLRVKEQEYLEKYVPFNSSIGYNIQKYVNQYSSQKKNKKVTSKITLGYKWSPDAKQRHSNLYKHEFGKSYKLLSPDDKIVIGKGIRELSRNYNLHENSIRKLIRGEKKCYKGWINLNNLPNTIKLISPNGIIYEVFESDLSNFAKEHRLPSKTFCVSYLKKFKNQKNKTHLYGWTLSEKIVKKFYLISPENKKHLIIKKYSAMFCKKYNLNPACITHLKAGRLKSHKGWRYQQYV